jgi:hypothetical protein
MSVKREREKVEARGFVHRRTKRRVAEKHNIVSAAVVDRLLRAGPLSDNGAQVQEEASRRQSSSTPPHTYTHELYA